MALSLSEEFRVSVGSIESCTLESMRCYGCGWLSEAFWLA